MGLQSHSKPKDPHFSDVREEILTMIWIWKKRSWAVFEWLSDNRASIAAVTLRPDVTLFASIYLFCRSVLRARRTKYLEIRAHKRRLAMGRLRRFSPAARLVLLFLGRGAGVSTQRTMCQVAKLESIAPIKAALPIGSRYKSTLLVSRNSDQPEVLRADLPQGACISLNRLNSSTLSAKRAS